MTKAPVFANVADIAPLKVAGEDLFFLADHSQTGSYEIYLHDGPKDAGPIPHSHPWDEAFYVIQGEVEFEAGDVKKVVGPGELVHVPAGMQHTFRYLSAVQILSVTTTDGARKLFDRLALITAGKSGSADHG